MLSFSDYLKYIPFMQEKGKNQIIIDQLVEYFKKSIKDESDDSTKRLFYHTFFEITLREEDYQDRYQALKLVIVPGAVKRFCEIIKAKRWRYSNYNCPHAPFWQFQFTPEVSQEIQESTLKPFEIKITNGDLCPTGYTVDDTNDKVDVGSLTVSVKSSDSSTEPNVKKYVYNKSVFVDIEEPEPGVFIFPMNDFKSESSSTNQPTIYAKFEITSKDGFFIKKAFLNSRVKTFDMTTTRLKIAGKNAQNEIDGTPVLIIDDSKILTPHATLEYKDGNLQISSEQNVKVLTNRIGKTPVRLKTGDTIVLNDSIQITIRYIR